MRPEAIRRYECLDGLPILLTMRLPEQVRIQLLLARPLQLLPTVTMRKAPLVTTLAPAPASTRLPLWQILWLLLLLPLPLRLLCLEEKQVREAVREERGVLRGGP